MKKKKHTLKHLTALTVSLAVILLALLIAGIKVGTKSTANSEEVQLYLPTGITYSALTDTLKAHNVVNRPRLFAVYSHVRGLDKDPKSGHYILKPHTTYIRLIQRLYTGNQDPIRITINKQRTLRNLCDYVATKMEFTSDSLFRLLTSEEFLSEHNLTSKNVISLFTQNTYEVYWNMSPRRFAERMAMETDAFWTKEREKKREALNLSRAEVVTLASIVDVETLKNDEKPTIASVYLNRLRKGIKLEADPTVKYAVGDFTLRRITGVHLKVESPYNTYRRKGLPPGPICLPGVESIDAVLDNKKTNYLYFCAKEDFSGYHNFATSLSQHYDNAKRFHKALNDRKIYK